MFVGKGVKYGISKMLNQYLFYYLVVRRKLQEWRESKGISYKRPPMPVKPPVTRAVSVPQPFWPSMKVEDEAHSLICAVDRSLADCIKLLAEVNGGVRCACFETWFIDGCFHINCPRP